MPRINLPASKHAAPAPTDGWEWLPYTDQAFINTLNRAIRIIDRKIKDNKGCNDAFSDLPGGRTFLQVWTDLNVWISFDHRRQQGTFGATLGNDITLTAFTLAMGRWTTAATLVHELAHVNGAPGGNSHQAEGTLRNCLLQQLEDPDIVGQIIRSSPLSGSMY